MNTRTINAEIKLDDEELDAMLLSPIQESPKALRGESSFNTISAEEGFEEIINSELESTEIIYDYEVDFEDLASSSWMQEMLNLINSERQKAGVSPLCTNNKLSSAAQGHTDDMVNKDFFSHTGSDGSSVSTRVTRKGYKWRTVAENVAINNSVVGAQAAFMKSSGHRANILSSSYVHVGLAKATQTSGKWKGRQYYTQVFASSNSESCSSSVTGNGGGTEKEDNNKPPSSCSDSPRGWHDSGGAAYSCAWYEYSKNFNCKAYGDKYRNFGKTANEACCTCGGGSF